MTARLPVSQGIEVPNEDSDSCESHCGQATTLPFYVTYSSAAAPVPDPWPQGDPEGLEYHQANLSWQRDWTYRRVSAGAAAHSSSASPGETSVINVEGGNDYANGYFLYALDSPELKAQLDAGAWRGGINCTAYAAAEQRAYGFYHWFKLNASDAITPFLSLNATHTGTATGLSKMPYLRDTRRSSRVSRPAVSFCEGFVTFFCKGLGGFRLLYDNISADDGGGTAVRWSDTVGLGEYLFADIHKMTADTCPLPHYIKPDAHVLPFFIPFRALTVDGHPNVLVAGKNMAASFFANAATRVHPNEYSSGVAAGVAAAIM